MGVEGRYKLLMILIVISILIASSFLFNGSIESTNNDFRCSKNTLNRINDLFLNSDRGFKIICIPFAKSEEDLIPEFELKTNISYKVGKATIYTSLNISYLSFHAERVDFWYHNEPSPYMLYLEFLVERAAKGDFSWEVKRQIELARKGEEFQYLAELISWLDKNMSNEEMVGRVLDRLHRDAVYSDEALKHYGAYWMLHLLSQNETYFLTSCNPPFDPPPPNVWYRVSNWQKAGRVWIGCYSSGVPSASYFLGEFCASQYTTDLNYYWNLAKSGHCGVPGSQVNSIQVKFFYSGLVSGYSWSHDMIWEMNKNSTREWSRYGVKFKTTNPPAGHYMFSNFKWILTCCPSPRRYCNTHCSSCFAFDNDATQHFITGQP